VAGAGHRFAVAGLVTFLPAALVMVLFWLLPETRGREPEDLWPGTLTGLPHVQHLHRRDQFDVDQRPGSPYRTPMPQGAARSANPRKPASATTMVHPLIAKHGGTRCSQHADPAQLVGDSVGCNAVSTGF